MLDRQAGGYWIPIIKALTLHLVIFGLFLYSWESVEKPSILVPQVIVQAKVLVMEDPIKARQKKEKIKRKAEQKKRAAAKKRKQELAKRKALERKKKLAAKRKAEEKSKAAEKKKAAEKRKTVEKNRVAEKQRRAEDKRREAQRLKKEQQRASKNRELDIAQALAAESEYQQSQKNTPVSGSYIATIQRRIIENWHRPLSARNGMQAIVMIHLVPTGEVQNVYLVKGSGDAAFDRSAIQAVQRAGKFEELQRLSPRQFDANFRKFRIVFKPEDLIR